MIRGYTLTKRAMDIVFSASALLLMSPFLLLIALAVRLETSGAALFWQTRIGIHGVPFRIVKFRTMRRNAAIVGSWQTTQNDPRITALGKHLRRTSFDELPQLWNVLKGEMSLIGPRPVTPEQIVQYSPEDWQFRHRVKPGITGLAQVSGRSELVTQQQVEYDRHYIEQLGYRMDMMILCRSFYMVMQKTGVN